MKRLILAAGLWGLMGAGPVLAKDTRDPTGNLRDDEALRCILSRLQETTGAGKGWKIELRELAGTSRDFVATNGPRSEKGTINVARSYPNQGALRVYLVPRD